jgi:transposase
MTPCMLDALCKQLLPDPGMYQDEIARFVHKEFAVEVSHASISRALKSIRGSKKKTRQAAREQNAELKSYYLHKISQFRSYWVLVLVDLY